MSDPTPLPEYWECFALHYAQARQKFLTAAAALQATTTSYAHPDKAGPHGEPLHVDLAWIGPTDAKRVLVVISGTHGSEGAAGSAIQTGWLRTAPTLPDSFAVALIHAINPWGFAHGSRTDEHNVDLNRNFLDFDRPLPTNTGYAALHPSLTPRQWDSHSLDVTGQALDAYVRTHGQAALLDAMTAGQYAYPDGIMFGGVQRAWSNRRLQEIVDTHLQDALEVACMDLHTGIGEHAKATFMGFHTPGGAQQARAAQLWEPSTPAQAFVPRYQGLLVQGVASWLNERLVAATVVEYGTRGPTRNFASRVDRWLRFEAPTQRADERLDMLRADMADTLIPIAGTWRNTVLRHGVNLIGLTVQRLANAST